MDAIAIQQQLLKFKGARNNLLLVVIFTTINLFLTAFETGFYFLFSATVPQIIFEIGQIIAIDSQNKAFLFGGAIVAFIGIAMYLVCWSLANRFRVAILVALILFSIDTLLCVFFVFTGPFDIMFLVDIAFHIWVLITLIFGVIAWAKLQGVNLGDSNAVINEMSNKPRGV